MTAPRPPLTRDRVVAEAVALADAEGLSALTVRRLADRLGFAVMALYRHVGTKVELVHLMVDSAYGPPPDLGSGDWRERLRALARADWALYHRHPWLLHVSDVRPALGPNAVAAYDTALSALDGTGLRGHAARAVLSLVNHVVRGAARDALDAARAESESGVTDAEWWAHRHPGLVARTDPGRHPAIAANLAEDGHLPPGDMLDFELERVLDGVEALIATRATAAGGTCAVCGAAAPRAATGRPRGYCSAACRQRAYRARRGSAGGR